MAKTSDQPVTTESETAAIRADITGTREDMSRTVDTIEERLSPAHIKGQAADVKDAVVEQFHGAKDQIKDDIASELRHAKSAVRDATVGRVEHMAENVRQSATDVGTNVLDTIRENPIPATMIALGMGWLIMGRSHKHTRQYGGDRETASVGDKLREGASRLTDEGEEMARDVGDKAQELAYDARNAAVHFAEGARDTGRRVGRGASGQLRRGQRNLEQTMRDNPLAVGAVTMAIGAAIGLSLPHTSKEDEWMGEPKERLLERGKNVAEGALSRVEERVDELTSPSQGQEGAQASAPRNA